VPTQAEIDQACNYAYNQALPAALQSVKDFVDSYPSHVDALNGRQQSMLYCCGTISARIHFRHSPQPTASHCIESYPLTASLPVCLSGFAVSCWCIPLILVIGTLHVSNFILLPAGRHVTAAQGHVDLMCWLAAHGADINLLCTAMGSTPLHAAAFYGHDECVNELLLRGADTTITNTEGATALDEAGSATVKALFKVCLCIPSVAFVVHCGLFRP